MIEKIIAGNMDVAISKKFKNKKKQAKPYPLKIFACIFFQ
jgi:hypothetical protein